MGYPNQRKYKADIIDSDVEIKGNDIAVQKEQRESVFPCPTLLHDINGNSVRPGEILKYNTRRKPNTCIIHTRT